MKATADDLLNIIRRLGQGELDDNCASLRQKELFLTEQYAQSNSPKQ